MPVLNGVDLTLGRNIVANGGKIANYNGYMDRGVVWNGNHFLPPLVNPVLYLPGYPGQGSVIKDYSGNAYNGTIVGATWSRLPSGQPILRFDGNDYININSSLTGLASSTKGTWMCWVKLDDATPAAISMVISFGDANVNENISLFFGTNGTLIAQARAAVVDKWGVVTDAAALSDGKYAHIALIQDGTSPVLLVNGVAVAQTFSVSTDKTVWFSGCAGLDTGRLGCSNFVNLGNSFFLTNGNLALEKLINTNLTVAQVLNIVNQERWLFGV